MEIKDIYVYTNMGYVPPHFSSPGAQSR